MIRYLNPNIIAIHHSCEKENCYEIIEQFLQDNGLEWVNIRDKDLGT